MLNVNYKYVSKVTLKLLSKYSNLINLPDDKVKKMGMNAVIFRNWVVKIQELAMADKGLHES
jgi:hypothetical protein